VAKWSELFFNPKKQERINKSEIENRRVIITSIWQYQTELEKGTTDFDFSKLNMEFEDIQNVNLENLHLNINLRNVSIPHDDCCKFGKYVITPIGLQYGDNFLKINNSKLGGNNVTGDLTPFKNLFGNTVYVWYSEETFDDKYKAQYPHFFISKDAEEELREKYYNPAITEIEAINSEGKPEKKEIIVRQNLTLEEYLKYYKFLKGKYLGNFSISKEDLLQIEIIEKYGLEQREEILKQISNVLKNINQTADCENYTIDKLDSEGACLTLNLKFKNKSDNT